MILESGIARVTFSMRERVVFVTDRNKVLSTNGRMQFWLPKMDETASFEIWWWQWQCHSFRTETIIILTLSHYTPSAWSVWLTNGSNWVSLCYYISNTLEGEKGTPQYFFLVLLLSLSLSHFQSKKKKWWELISGSSSITISSPCVIRWALIKPSFFVFNEIIVILFLCDTVEDFRFWGLVWFLWFFQ